jgi:hypothetical protein
MEEHPGLAVRRAYAVIDERHRTRFQPGTAGTAEAEVEGGEPAEEA